MLNREYAWDQRQPSGYGFEQDAYQNPYKSLTPPRVGGWPNQTNTAPLNPYANNPWYRESVADANWSQYNRLGEWQNDRASRNAYNAAEQQFGHQRDLLGQQQSFQAQQAMQMAKANAAQEWQMQQAQLAAQQRMKELELQAAMQQARYNRMTEGGW